MLIRVRASARTLSFAVIAIMVSILQFAIAISKLCVLLWACSVSHALTCAEGTDL